MIKIVYSIVSSKDDFYLEQLLLSVKSLLYYNFNIDIIVVCDKDTNDGFVGSRAKILNTVAKIIVVDVPTTYSKIQKSRYIKTNLREVVEGDFLFIDTDTVICGSLMGIDRISADIAMCADLNEGIKLTDSNTINRCRQAGFPDMGNKPYFNSGVMFVRDTPMAHKFYEGWHKQWLFSVANGVPQDQPSMNFTNSSMGNVVTQLPDEWNCQIYFNGWDCLPKAKILHYAGGGEKELLKKLYSEVKSGNSSDKLLYYISNPKTRLYAYLTGQDNQLIPSILVYLHVHCNWLYNLIARIHG